MNASRKWTIMLLLTSLIVSVSFAANAAVFTSAPLNPEFVLAQQQSNSIKATSPAGKPLGYRPFPLDLSHVTQPTQGVFATSKAVFPPQYDLRDYNYMTAVRNQNPYGTCWSFGAFASLESTLKKMWGSSHDYSEWHLAYFVYVDESATMPAFTASTPEFGEDPIFDQGGNSWQAAALLARWTGAVNETARPYQNVSPWPESSRPRSTDPVSNHLENVYYLPVPFITFFDRDTIKNALMSYGAVSIRMVWDNAAYNATTSSYYNPAMTGGGHIVAIAGWDDNYSAANFGTTPASNGAWLVKNSWGTEWGEAGYFWVSYMDPTLNHPAVFIGASTTNFDNIYQYDPLGWTNALGAVAAPSNTAWFANIFTATGSGTTASTTAPAATTELLKAVSFYAAQSNSTYRIEVRTGVTAGTPASGTLANFTEGTLTAAGYHTVRLSSDVTLPLGGLFSVIVRLTTPGYNFPIPVEEPRAGYSEKARANTGESFYSWDGGTWQDITIPRPNANVCLKAFTSAGSTPTPTITPTPTVTPTPTPGSGGGGCSIGAGATIPALLLLMIPLAMLLKNSSK
jgi:C1A family cysteine protease